MGGHNYLTQVVRSVLARTVEVERRIAGAEFKGRIKDVDSVSKTLRMIIGTDPEGNDVYSPRVPFAQTAGDLKIHDVPTPGQQGSIRTANGDIQQGSFFPLHWSEGFEAISDDPDLKRIEFGDVVFNLTANGFNIQIGDTVFSMSSDGILLAGSSVEATGNSLTHNGTNVGDDHVHDGVMVGDGNTGTPH